MSTLSRSFFFFFLETIHVKKFLAVVDTGLSEEALWRREATPRTSDMPDRGRARQARGAKEEHAPRGRWRWRGWKVVMVMVVSNSERWWRW